MEQSLAGSDDYLKHRHRSAQVDRPGSAEEVLESVFQELSAEWDPEIGSGQR
jgi:hypothetical protein